MLAHRAVSVIASVGDSVGHRLPGRNAPEALPGAFLAISGEESCGLTLAATLAPASSSLDEAYGPQMAESSCRLVLPSTSTNGPFAATLDTNTL